MRPWIVWGIGVVAYVVAVLNRTSFGVSGLDAAGRFEATPGILSAFVMLQIIVYAGMQIPAGILLDRFGSRAMIATGMAAMAAGQLTLALTHALPIAIGAYGIVGLGDAFIFISVIRLLPNWFAPTRVPVLTQVTGVCGQFGQVLSAVPFLSILLHHGWAAAYLAAAALTALCLMLVVSLTRDSPIAPPQQTPTRTLRTALADVRAVWVRPGTRLGFFTHMGTQFSVTVFALMWGVPYLTTAQDIPRSRAGALLILTVVVFVVFGVVVGVITARHPERRPAVVLAMIAASATAWTSVLLLPFPAPAWLLTILIGVISIGGPVSIIAFDFARTFNPPTSLGTAQGMVNTGGFIASLLTMQSMGLIIDAAGGYSFDAFRFAWCVQYVIWAVAATGVGVYARRVRHSEALGTRAVKVV